MAHDIILALAYLRSRLDAPLAPTLTLNRSEDRSEDRSEEDVEVVRVGSSGAGLLRLKGGASVYEQVEANIAKRNVAYQLRFISDQLNYGTITDDEAQELSARSVAQHLLAPMGVIRMVVDALVVALIAAVTGSILGASACVLSTNVVCPEMTQAVTVASMAAALGVNLVWNLGVRTVFYCGGWADYDEPRFRKKVFIAYGFVLLLRFFAPSIVLLLFADLFNAIAPIATFVPVNQTELNITGLNLTDSPTAAPTPSPINTTLGNGTASNETSGGAIPEQFFETVFQPGLLVFAFEEYWRAWGVILGSTIAFCCCCCCCGIAISYKFDLDPDDWFEPFSDPVRERPAWMDKPYPAQWDSESRKKFLQEHMKKLEEEQKEQLKLEQKMEKEKKKEEKKQKKRKKPETEEKTEEPES